MSAPEITVPELIDHLSRMSASQTEAYREYRDNCAKAHVCPYIHVSRWIDWITYRDENMNNVAYLSNPQWWGWW